MALSAASQSALDDRSVHGYASKRARRIRGAARATSSPPHMQQQQQQQQQEEQEQQASQSLSMCVPEPTMTNTKMARTYGGTTGGSSFFCSRKNRTNELVSYTPSSKQASNRHPHTRTHLRDGALGLGDVLVKVLALMADLSLLLRSTTNHVCCLSMLAVLRLLLFSPSRDPPTTTTRFSPRFSPPQPPGAYRHCVWWFWRTATDSSRAATAAAGRRGRRTKTAEVAAEKSLARRKTPIIAIPGSETPLNTGVP